MLWDKLSASSNTHLEYISFEKYPMSLESMLNISKKFEALKNVYRELLDRYNPNPSLNTYEFGNVSLKLIIDDVNHIDNYSLPKVDAWFLDGFSPSKNKSMWQDSLFHNMKEHSHSDTTFATFTASSKVRKALQKYGFNVKKDTGYGKKREMMYGNFGVRGN